MATDSHDPTLQTTDTGAESAPNPEKVAAEEGVDGQAGGPDQASAPEAAPVILSTIELARRAAGDYAKSKRV